MSLNCLDKIGRFLTFVVSSIEQLCSSRRLKWITNLFIVLIDVVITMEFYSSKDVWSRTVLATVKSKFCAKPAAVAFL